MYEIAISIIGTVVGGLFLAGILFFINEHIFPLHNLTGEWDVTTLTEKTLYNPYQNMKLYYKFHLLQKGQEIIGSGEKIKETLSTGRTDVYKRDKRTLSVVNGYFERNIFGANKVYLKIIEYGRLRQTRTTFILKVKNKNTLIGTFISTAADSSGQTILKK